MKCKNGLFLVLWLMLTIESFAKPGSGIVLASDVIGRLQDLSPSIEQDKLVVSKAIAFDSGITSFLYMEIDVGGLDHKMGHWSGPILMKVPFEEADWSNASAYYVNRRLDDRELRRATIAEMRSIIEELCIPMRRETAVK